MATPQLEGFVREMLDLVSRAADPKLVVDPVSEAVRRLLSGSFFLDDRFGRPSKEGLVANELYRDPDGRLVVHACAWAPQISTPVHDHAGWGVIAGYLGRVVVTSYRRLDDATTAGYASLTEWNRVLVADTSYAFIRPPDESIHRIENPFREPAVTIHVLGGELATQNVFDAKAKSVMEIPAPSPTFGV